MQFVNSFLNKKTMYWLMMYYLIFLLGVAAVLSFLHILPYNGLDILIEAFYLTLVCKVSNQILSKIFKVKTNPESAIITGLILSLIFGPTSPIANPLLLTGAAVFAMTSKYIIAWKGKHIFNPAAFGAVASAVVLGQGASWWVGNPWMLVPILLGGLLVLKKIRRFEMVAAYLTVMIGSLLLINLWGGGWIVINWIDNMVGLLIRSPILFFASVMLVEPLTSPVKKTYQIIYAFLVATWYYLSTIGIITFAGQYPLELSLLVGNVFSYMVSGKFRQAMVLKEKKQLSHDVIAFKFEPTRKFPFKAGQYLEWTLSHPHPDNRGIRRFFTIASAPTEAFVMLASKFYEKPSTFKQILKDLEPGDEIIVSDLEGEFTLPKDTGRKLVFIAGGIGITPFRSMVKWMIDNGEHRDAVLLFSNKTEADIVFEDLFDQAEELGVRTVYVNTDKMGYIDEKMIKSQIPDWKERLFYVSGPEPMVEAFEKMLYSMGLSKRQVKRDYFPGYTETHTK